VSGELVASLVLKLVDQGSAAATRALAAITRATKDTGDAAKSASAAAISAAKRTADAREVLGIRAEKAIQNEIRQTEAAYQRLAESGRAGARELARAQEAVREKVSRLRQELDGVKSSAGGAGNALTRAMSIAGGLAAGRAVLAGPVSRTMNYSMELAHTSNTLYATKSVAERIAAKSEINAAVMRGVRGNGGTREESLAALKTLGASGEFGDDPKAAFAMLPSVMRAATASGADANQMASIAIKAKQNMGLTNTDRVFGMAAKGGIEGQFELRDMAKWLPQQMAYTKRTGLHGEAGFATLIALNQVAMRTAGSADDAGNNVRNLLGKINSADTANDAKKLGIDLSGTLAAAQAKGVGGVDAFLNLTEQIAAKDQRLVKLRAQAKGAKGDDLRANLDAQAGILEGSAIGKLVQDQQAMSALVAALNGRQEMNAIRGNVLNESGTIDSLHKVVSGEAAFQAQQAAAESANAMQNALNGVNPLLGSMAGGLGKMMEQYPALAAALAGTTLAVTSLGVAAGTAAIGLSLTGGGKAGLGALAGGVLGGLGRAPGAALGALAAWGPGAFAGSVALGAGFAAGSIANDAINWSDKKFGNTNGEDIGRLVAFLMAGLGDKDAERALNIEVQIDGEKVAAAVTKRNSRDAGRH
jgi:hypothetical protein